MSKLLTFETEGSIIAVDETKTFASGFQKREFVIKVESGKYPQDIKFEVVKDQCEELGKYQRGDVVKVTFDLRGNEFKERYYVNLVAWRVELIEKSGKPSQQASGARGQQNPQPTEGGWDDKTDGDEYSIPF